MKTLQERHDEILREVVSARRIQSIIGNLLFQLEYDGYPQAPQLLYTLRVVQEEAFWSTTRAMNKLIAFEILNDW
jgi:hypothetical protein